MIVRLMVLAFLSVGLIALVGSCVAVWICGVMLIWRAHRRINR